MGTVSQPRNERIKGAAGTVARLVDRLLQQDPRAQVRFSSGPSGKPLELLSVYSDDNGIVWVDIGTEN